MFFLREVYSYMEKKSFFGKLDVKTIVATALGAALFLVLFYFVKIPSPAPNTNIQIAYGITTFFGALFGPISALLVGFAGHALNDFLAGFGVWWSWVIASAVAGFFAGCAYKYCDLEHGKRPGKMFFIFNIVGQFLAWVVIAPVLDIVMYAEPMETVFVQGLVSFVIDTLSALVVGYILCVAYAATRSSSSSLDKE